MNLLAKIKKKKSSLTYISKIANLMKIFAISKIKKLGQYNDFSEKVGSSVCLYNDFTNYSNARVAFYKVFAKRRYKKDIGNNNNVIGELDETIAILLSRILEENEKDVNENKILKKNKVEIKKKFRINDKDEKDYLIAFLDSKNEKNGDDVSYIVIQKKNKKNDDCETENRNLINCCGSLNIHDEKKLSIKQLVIVFGSDFGFCASYNHDVFDFFLETFEKNCLNTDVFVIGTKISELFKKKEKYLKSKKINEIKYFNLGFKNKGIEFFVNKIIDVYHKYEYMKVFRYDNKYNFLPLQTISFDDEKIFNKKKDSTVIEFDDKLNLLKKIIHLRLTFLFNFYFFRSQHFEQIIRMNNAESISKKVDKVINDLKIKHNKMRQEMITREINEVIAGKL